MVCRRIVMTEKPASGHEFRKHFESGMTINVNNRHPEHKKHQPKYVNREYVGKYKYDSSFYDCLQRVKGKGRPRTRIRRQMVNFMKIFVERLPVHQPVSPVKIAIMDDDHHK